MPRKAVQIAEAAPDEPETAIVVAPATALAVLTDTARFEWFYEDIKRQVEAHEPDLTTEKGRKAIASLARKVVRTKTAIDTAGKELTEEWREKVKIVDKSRKEIRDRLDVLRDQAREPLTQWEAEEERRLDLVERTIADLRTASIVLMDATSAEIAERITLLEGVELSEDVLQGHFVIAESLRGQAIASLALAHARILREENDRAELAKLRAAEAERLERERIDREVAEKIAAEERLKVERERQKEQYARSIIQHITDCGNGFIGGEIYPFPVLLHELEKKVVIDESFGPLADEARKILADNLTKLRASFERHLKEERVQTERAAKEEAFAEASRKAREDHEKAERRHNEALAAEKRRADEAEAARKAEADRIAAEEAARAAEAKRLADEQAARDHNRKHRGEVMKAAKLALMEVGAEEEIAKKIILAIVAGEIPAVTLRF